MAVGCTEQVAAPQVEWVAMEEQWPPIGVEVLACGVGKEFGGIHTNQLDKGSDIGPGYDPELYYWAGGEDFDEVTHWAPLPAMPSVAREVELSQAFDVATSAHAAERAAADRLRGVLRQAAEAAGGCASLECSDEFLALLPGEVRALRERADQLERQAADRQAGADGWQAVYNRGRADGVKFRLGELEQERRIAAELQAVALRLIKTYITEDSKDEQRAIAWLARMRREVSQ